MSFHSVVKLKRPTIPFMRDMMQRQLSYFVGGSLNGCDAFGKSSALFTKVDITHAFYSWVEE